MTCVLALTFQSRLPGTRMKRQHTAMSTNRKIHSMIIDRLLSVFLTKGSLMRLKSIKVYSL